MGNTRQLWIEGLFGYDETIDRNTWAFQTDFAPVEYHVGVLAESWEQVDTETIIVHLRQGIHWQNIEPVNGREFTAEDVQFTYDRVLGTGSGYAEPHPFFASQIDLIKKVTATDKYTVEVKFNHPTAVGIFQLFSGFINIGAPECAELYGEDASDTRNAVGTGPWMLDTVEYGTSISYVKNPDYWGEDARYPGSQVPYLDSMKVLVIPDISTAMSAMRTGKIDIIYETGSGLTWQDAKVLEQTNPEIEQAYITGVRSGLCINTQNAPFNDINVRKALQMAINREEIATSYYGGFIDATPSGQINPSFEGWTTPFEDWSEELQAEYSYNPEKAKELLAGAGFSEGFDTSCVINASSDTDLIQIVQANLAEIGINMEIETLDRASYYSYIEAKKHEAMCIANQLGSPDKPFVAIKNRVSGYGMNFSSVEDPEYDALVENVAAATTLEEVQAGCIEADMYSIEKHWTLCLFSSITPVAWTPYLKGYSGELLMMPSHISRYTARWWVDSDLKASME
jgi:peptide/nickel transport system substrate-binding protein